MLLQPCGGLHLNFLNMLDAITHQGATEHRHVCSGHYHLDYVIGLINAAGRGQVGANFSVQNSNPVQSQAHIGRHTKRQIWRDLHLREIDVRLVKSIEQNQAVRAERIETLRHICEIAKVWAELHRQRDFGSRSDGSNSIDVCFFDCTAGNFRLSRYPIDVEFQRVGASLGDLTRVANPTSKGRAVQTRNDRNFYAALRAPDLLQVIFGSHLKFRPRRFCFGFFFKQ